MVNPYWQIVEILSTNPGYESDGIVENFQQKTSIYGKSSTQYNCEHIEFGFCNLEKALNYCVPKIYRTKRRLDYFSNRYSILLTSNFSIRIQQTTFK